MKPPKAMLTCSDVMCMASTLELHDRGLNEAGDAFNMEVVTRIDRIWFFTDAAPLVTEQSRDVVRAKMAAQGITVEFVADEQQAREQFRRLYPEGSMEE